MRFYAIFRACAACGLFYGKLKKIGKTLRQLAIKAVTLQCANVRSAWKPHVATVQLH